MVLGSAAHLGNEDVAKAIADAEEAIKTKPEFAKGYYRKAAALRALDKVDEAIEFIKALPEKIRESPDIVKLMEQLQIDYREDNFLGKDHPEILRFNTFLKWLDAGGAKYDKIKMRYYGPDYRGVHARTKIKRNEIFLIVPKELIITLEMAKTSPIGAKMEKAHLSLLSPKHSFLSTYVLQEVRKPDTKWTPYFDMLPKSTSNFPIFFTEEEDKWLEGSPFLDQVKEKREDVKKDYNTITGKVPEYTQFSFQEFGHYRMLISSRIFGICVNGVKTDALVPLAGIHIFSSI